MSNFLKLWRLPLSFVLLIVLTLYSLGTHAEAEDKPATVSPAELLSANPCLQQLKDKEEVVITAAFHDGTGGFGQLKELIARKPWGTVGTTLQSQLDQLVEELSPFLIVNLTKKQALTLDSHRDLIKWILVQSTDKACG